MAHDDRDILSCLRTRLHAEALDIFGAFHTDSEDMAPEGISTLVMIGPKEPGFWANLTSSPEWNDGLPDPIDRWSKRVIGEAAKSLSAHAYFPSDGPPYLPFYQWALKSGRTTRSPVTLLVHDTAGLMVSFRGALGFSAKLPLPAPKLRNCEPCDRPCETACPAGALTAQGYDVPRCHAHLETPAGQDCLNKGCRVRRSCPISKSYGRLEEQSAYHMSLFHPVS